MLIKQRFCKMELGSKLWSCSDLEKGLRNMSDTPEAELALRKRIEETCFCYIHVSRYRCKYQVVQMS